MTDLSYTNDIKSEVKKNLERSVHKGSSEITKDLTDFVDDILYLAIRNSNLELYNNYLELPEYLYHLVTDKRDSGEAIAIKYAPFRVIIPSQILRDKLGHQLYNLGSNVDEEVSVDIATAFYYQTFVKLNSLLKTCIVKKDPSGFSALKLDLDSAYQTAMFYYDEARREKKKNTGSESHSKTRGIELVGEKVINYYRRSLMGLKYWVNYLLYRDIIDVFFFTEITRQIRIPQADSMDIIGDLIFAADGNNENYLDWSTWSVPVSPGEKTAETLAPSGWMKIGFMIEALRKGSFYFNAERLDGQELALVDALAERLEEISMEFVGHEYEKWLSLFEVQSQSGLRERIRQVLSSFTHVRPTATLSMEKEIAVAKLSEERIERFKSRAGAAWKKQTRMRTLFQLFHNTEVIPANGRKLVIAGQRNLLLNGKSAFIDDDRLLPVYGNEDITSRIGFTEDDLLFKRIANQDEQYLFGDDIAVLLDQAIKELRSRGVEPNVIITYPEYSYRDAEFLRSVKFKGILNLMNDGQSLPAFTIGNYDNLPIYTSFSEFLTNRFIVCNLNKAFVLEYKTNGEWYENLLNLDVRELSEADIDERIAQTEEKWRKLPGGATRSRSEVITYLKSSVLFDAWTILDFKIKDANAYIVAEVVPNIGEPES